MRKWVWDGLCAVLIDGQYSNLYIKNHLKEVDSKDRALATNIFYGTLQNYLYCEYIWKQFAQKKPNKKIQILLCMSVYQIKFLDKVPTYAIIDSSVSLVKKMNPKSAGFVNAILRKCTKDINLPEKEEERLSIQYSCPLWLVKMWKAQYPEHYIDFLKSTCVTFPIYIRRNSINCSKEEMEKEFQMYMDPLYIYNGNDISSNPFYTSGKLSVQDEGSYHISKFLEAEKGMHVLDTCAAPGTKTFSIAEQMNDMGEITALDIHSHRVSLIHSDAKRLHIHIVNALCKDATDIKDLPDYDRILCDVPCSGYGVLARKPDMKYHMESNDMDTLIPLQKKILESASNHLKINGKLVYSTCTMNKKENEKQVQNFLQSHSNFILEEEKNIFPSENREGFYMARLKRVL